MNSFTDSNDFYRSVFNNLSIGIYMMDLSGKIISANPYMCKILEFSEKELQMKTCFNLTHPDDLETTQNNLNRLLEGNLENISFSKRFLRKNGDHFWTSVGVFLNRNSENTPQFFISHIKDISREKELESQLRHAQKTEAVATLAGGIAHDFNNILSSILGNAEFAVRHELKDDAPGAYSVRQIIKAAKRASFLVKQILTFSRRRKPELAQISVNPIVKEITKLLKKTLPANIEIRLSLKNQSDILMADPVNVHQILMNLCTNAAEAMQEKGGKLEILLENTDQNDIDPLNMPQGPSSKFLKIIVRDDGIGMPPEIRERIFEPYFTTKSMKKGTGLGLPVVYGIVEDLKGAVDVESKQGEGACFTVILPLFERKQEPPAPTVTNRNAGPGARILFVDDDEQIIEFMIRSMETMGYQVTAKADSVGAFACFKQDPTQFDIVISDMNMNGYTGDVLARKILEIRPDIPVIICTGYDELLAEEQAEKIGIRDIVMKPFMVDQLDEKIRQILTIDTQSELKTPGQTNTP